MKNIPNLVYYAVYLLTCLVFIGCGQYTGDAASPSAGGFLSGREPSLTGNSSASGNSVAVVSALSPEKISLDGHKPETFLYSSVDNTPAMITRKESRYTLYLLRDGTSWKKSTSWKCKGSEVLDTFTYGSDGALYCCLKEFKKKTLIRQKFLKCKKDGSFQEIKLQKLGGKEIRDIRFDSTALAMTFADHSVRIYNISEKRALGALSLKGMPGKNLFYRYHYITETASKDSKSILLRDYDIRSGETDKSFVLGKTRETKSASVHLSNYHGDICVLTPAGLYTGTFDEAVLFRQAGWEDMQIISPESLLFFQNARDDTLYYAWEDESHEIHFQKGHIREKESVDYLSKI